MITALLIVSLFAAAAAYHIYYSRSQHLPEPSTARDPILDKTINGVFGVTGSFRPVASAVGNGAEKISTPNYAPLEPGPPSSDWYGQMRDASLRSAESPAPSNQSSIINFVPIITQRNDHNSKHEDAANSAPLSQAGDQAMMNCADARRGIAGQLGSARPSNYLGRALGLIP